MRQIQLTRAGALLLLAAWLPACRAPAGVSATTPAACDARLAAIPDTIRAILAENDLPSMAIAAAENGRVICEAAFGLANREERIEATSHTMYSLASISKPITATAVMQLVERGRIDLDRPANQYLGATRLRAFEGDTSGATVRRLLTHTAGLPLHYQFFYAGGPPVPAMDDAIGRHGIIVYPPGERYVYSNFGFGILEHIVSRVSGRPFDDYLREEIFVPLGLTETTVSDGSALGSRAAVRYDARNAPLPPYTFDHVGASGLWSSAHDLVRFGMFHLGAGSADVLSRAIREEMQRVHAPAGPPGVGRGLGWGILESDNGWRRVSHTGSMPGVSTVLNIYPASGTVIVVLANRSHSPSITRAATAMASALLPGYADSAAARRQQVAAAALWADTAAAMPAWPPAIVGSWTGEIATRAGALAVTLLVPPAGAIAVTVADQPATELGDARVEDGWLTGRFTAAIGAADAAPPGDEPPRAVRLTVRDRGDRMSGWVSAIHGGDRPYGAVSFPVVLRRGN